MNELYQKQIIIYHLELIGERRANDFNNHEKYITENIMYYNFKLLFNMKQK